MTGGTREPAALAQRIDAYLVGLRVCLKFVGDPQCCETCGASYAAHLLREAAARLAAPVELICSNCGHANPHDGSAGATADACTHPCCTCGYYSPVKAGAASLPATRPTPQESDRVTRCTNRDELLAALVDQQRARNEAIADEWAASLPQGDGLAWLTDEVLVDAGTAFIAAALGQAAADRLQFANRYNGAIAMRAVLVSAAQTQGEGT